MSEQHLIKFHRHVGTIRPWISQDEAHQLLRELAEAHLKIESLLGAEAAADQYAARLDEAERQIAFLTTRLAKYAP
jgi:predicted hydrolase (HD superfamily)